MQRKREKKFGQKKKDEAQAADTQNEESKIEAKPTLTKEILSVATQDDKLSLIKLISKEITNFNEANFKKIDDLLLICEDPDVEIITAAVKQIVFVFCDVLPDYKIREDMDTEKEGHVMLSKNIKKMRKMEQYLLEAYKRYLQILETFTKFKPINVSEYTKSKYDKLKVTAFESYVI